MIFRSKAPLRLGFAGGGTDVSPYSETYGGSILNATINMYAHCTLEVTNDNTIVFDAKDIDRCITLKSEPVLSLDGELALFKGIYNRIIKDFNLEPLSFKLTTYSDAISGSGLGGSSTMVIAVLKAFVEWLNLPLGEYDIAHLAYKIERVDVGLSGGKQDQYAATFGGFNFMEFYAKDKVIVNPLRIKHWIINELEASLLIYFTGISRESANIINEQSLNAISTDKKNKSLDAMHEIKKDSIRMKEALLFGDIKKFAEILDSSWQAKKRTARSISNESIDNAYNVAKKAGAYAGKVSGAGGGGFMIFIVDPTKKINVRESLNKLGGQTYDVNFTNEGTQGWKI